MKRLKTLACVVATILLVGCQSGTGGTASNAGAGTPKDGKKFKIGVSFPAADHGWTAGLGYWARRAVKDYPDVDWIVEDAKGPDEQINDLQNMQAEGVDAVVVVTTEAVPVTPIAKKLREAGILIVNVSGNFAEPVADVFIEGDNKAFGRRSAEYMVQKLGGKGKIAILEGIPISVNTDRVEAALAVFKQYPGIQIVARDTGMWNREVAQKVTENMLVNNPQIDAVWAADDDMALGVEIALKAAGRDKNIWILGGGGMKDIVKRVMDGDPLYPGDITYPPSMIGFGIQTTVAMLRAGKENARPYTPRHIVLDLDLITPENAKEYYFPDSVY